jgi:serine/threonine protein kinase
MKLLSLNGKNYVVGKKIGSGSFGIVYNAILDNTKKKFAIKKFSDNYDLGTLREISMLKLLKNNEHNHIINMEDIIINNNNIYIVMKKYYMNLAEAIEKDILNNKTKNNIILKLTKALVFLKSNGIIHRDIKPENILLDKEFNPILCDFSLAKLFSGVHSEGTHTGKIATVTYRPPEVVFKKEYSFPVDSWSLGVVCFEMFFKQFLDFSTDKEILDFFRNNLGKIGNSTISKTLKGLLNPNPKKRWTPEDVLHNYYNLQYKPDIIFNICQKCVVSNTIKNICDCFDVEKKITRWAAQIYHNITKCEPHSAVLIACKFYETELQDFSDFEEFEEEEKILLKKMNFNLFI